MELDQTQLLLVVGIAVLTVVFLLRSRGKSQEQQFSKRAPTMRNGSFTRRVGAGAKREECTRASRNSRGWAAAAARAARDLLHLNWLA